MNKNKTKIVFVVTLLLITVSFLSGCIGANAITTWGWEHINDQGTAVRLWGHLVISENFHNWNAWFVYDNESHTNWEDYDNRVEADNYDDLNFFSVDIYNLSRSTEYHYRAVGESLGQGSTIRVGIDSIFIPGGPRVITYNASNIQITSVQLNGRLTDLGGASSCEVFFKYGDDKDNLNIETTHQFLSTISDFSEVISDLTSCKTYYYQTIAINDVDTWAGLVFEITPGLPNVETYLPTSVTTDSATYHGTLWALGGPTSCEVWFEYSDDNPNNLDETTPHQIVYASGQFDAIVEGLNSGTTYWVRAVADNGVCSDKGEIKEFKTATGLEKYGMVKNDMQRKSLKNFVLSLIEKEFGNTDPYTLKILQKQYPILVRILKL